MGTRARALWRYVVLIVSFQVYAGPALIQSQTLTSGDPALQAGLGEITVTLPGGVPLVMVRISAGTFEMGSPESERGRHSDEGPQHQVTISQDYYLGKYEVTQAQWRAVMGMIPAMGHGAGADYPVYYVSWNDIAGPGGFLETLNSQLGPTKLRFPTEAEWEYAARGGTTTPFSFGDDPSCTLNVCGDCALFNQYMVCSGSLTGYGSWPVGQKTENPWGLYDMHGNVWEWVQDCYQSSYVGAPTDGSAWEAPGCKYRVMRSGHWHGPAYACRSANREHESADLLRVVVGFRLAMNAGPVHPIRRHLLPTP
jgi:formylglycine-generating enzyme required for sulfatase activity